MKKAISMLVFVFFFTFASSAFAQVAKIVDLGGQASVKVDLSADWNKAKINMLLGKDAEIQTGRDSYCTLAFDDEMKNIVTIKQNSQIKIDSIKPGNISLQKGRVFSLINSLSKNEKFQVRTPAAIAGARGTGWSTDYNGKNASAKCFENTIYVQGLDAKGDITGQMDLLSGSGINIGGGSLGNVFDLSDEDNEEWSDFISYIDTLTSGASDSGHNPLGDLRQDQRDDLREALGQQRRQENTSTPTTPGGQERQY
ncbi:MAG: FecR domain-containing protein [Candidatus Omnitrophica bacterium]|nr:FecR domain-containing protein [Candidatus Omnitrophota bacterium]